MSLIDIVRQSFFDGANNVTVLGSSFSTNGMKAGMVKSGFDLLQEHVATSAVHNSKQRLDTPRCHEHTREAVLQDLLDWISGTLPRTTWMAWLNGAAGAGKTAICQSLAELCIARGILVASFFFGTDSTRNTIDRLVATLAYQVIQLLPKTKELIVQAIQSNPLIFELSLEKQFNDIIVKPLRSLHASDPTWKLVVIIDGVDECGQTSQRGDLERKNLIFSIANVLRPMDLPFVVLFGSRRENDLVMAFKSPRVDINLSQFPLDDHYQPEIDIRLFLDDSFDNIKKTHPFRDLPVNWPSPSHVQEIVDKSSGQFIYASVVIKFLSIATASPSNQLEIIRGLRPPDTGGIAPFAELDTLYRHIFAQVLNLPAALKILAFTFFASPHFLQSTLYFLRITREDMRTILAPLASVLGDLNEDELKFSHASLPEFLRSKERSREYCIDTLPTQLSVLWFDNLASGQFPMLAPADITNLIEHVEAGAEIYQKLLAYAPSQQHSSFRSVALNFCGHYPARFLNAVRNLEFGDEGKAYQYLLNMIVRYVKKEFPASVRNIAESGHDISQILEEIKNEEQEFWACRSWNRKLASVNDEASKREALTMQAIVIPADVQNSHALPNITPSTFPARTASCIPKGTKKRMKTSGSKLVTNTESTRRSNNSQGNNLKVPIASATSDRPTTSGDSPCAVVTKHGATFSICTQSHLHRTHQLKNNAYVTGTIVQVAQLSKSRHTTPTKQGRSGTAQPPPVVMVQKYRSVEAAPMKVQGGKSAAAPKTPKKPPWR